MTDQEALARGVALLPEWTTMSWARGVNEFTINRVELETLIAALSAADRIAKPAMLGGGGMVMVPREPTEEMIKVGVAKRHSQYGRETSEIYKAMIAAAPAPASNGEAVDTRQCTCHPDDNPPRPCPRKYALSECRAALAAIKPEKEGE